MKSLKRVHIFVLAAAISFALMYFSYVPVVGLLGHVLVLFSTLTHELGHGLMAMVLGGDFEKLVINWDGSGVTYSSGSHGRIARALISAGGLIGPACWAAVLFWSAKGSDNKLNYCTRFFGLSLLIAGVLVARSPWALAFTVGLGAALIALSMKLPRKALESIIVFIGVQLGLSVFTRADYLFTKTASGVNLPSDVAQMSEALFLPYWFWGIVCGLFSVVVLYWGCRCYIEE